MDMVQRSLRSGLDMLNSGSYLCSFGRSDCPDLLISNKRYKIECQRVQSSLSSQFRKLTNSTKQMIQTKCKDPSSVYFRSIDFDIDIVVDDLELQKQDKDHAHVKHIEPSQAFSNKKSSKMISKREQLSIEKLLAQIFIHNNYGYIEASRTVKDILGFTITAGHYNNTMSAIVRRAFRLLQNILISTYEKNNLTKLAYLQTNKIRSPMLQCRKWLNPCSQKTLFHLIEASYLKNGTNITQQQAVKLYGQLLASAGPSHEVRFLLLHKGRQKKESQQPGLSFKHNSQRILLKQEDESDK